MDKVSTPYSMLWWKFQILFDLFSIRSQQFKDHSSTLIWGFHTINPILKNIWLHNAILRDFEGIYKLLIYKKCLFFGFYLVMRCYSLCNSSWIKRYDKKFKSVTHIRYWVWSVICYTLHFFIFCQIYTFRNEESWKFWYQC